MALMVRSRGTGKLKERVAFDAPQFTPDGSGGRVKSWGDPETALKLWAEFIYARGSEAIEASRLTGKAVFKIRVRQSAAARKIATDWRMRHPRLSQEYNIREIDSITDRKWIYIVAESGVAI